MKNGGTKTQKYFLLSITKKAWRENGNKPRLTIFENGGRRKNGDRCFDLHLIIGYTIFNYCNHDLTRQIKRFKEKKRINK